MPQPPQPGPSDLVSEHRLAARDYQRLSSKAARLKRELEQTLAAKKAAKKLLGQIEVALRADLKLDPGTWICERCGVTRLDKKHPICRQCADDKPDDKPAPPCAVCGKSEDDDIHLDGTEGPDDGHEFKAKKGL